MQFLALQNLPLRVDDDSNSNFLQILKLRGIDDSRIVQWLHRKSSKYTSPEIQNKILEIMSLKILRDLASQIRKATLYSIMGDECTGVSNIEQFALCFQWDDDDICVHEDFFGLYQVPDCRVFERLSACLSILSPRTTPKMHTNDP